MILRIKLIYSWAVVTPGKYECDIQEVSSVLIILNNWENNGTEEIGLATPTLICPCHSDVP